MESIPPGSWAVIFSSQHTGEDESGYAEMVSRMEELVAQQPGYLGHESVRNENGFGITISYWESKEDIERWRQNSEHQIAQRKGRTDWYSSFLLIVCQVESQRKFP